MAIDWFDYLAPRIPGLKQGTTVWARARVPWRDDKKPSLAVNRENGAWKDHGTGQTGNAKELCEKLNINYPRTHKRGSKEVISTPRPPRADSQSHSSTAKIIATYNYSDKKGNVIFRKRRTSDKQFWFQRPDAKGGWVNGLGDIKPVPYRLHELLNAKVVCIVEGEPDADNLHDIGLTATTAPFGADRWPEDFGPLFNGKEIWLFRDNDKPGRRYQIEAALNSFPEAASLKLIALPGLGDKEDVSDWYNKGHTKEELLKICHGEPALTQEDLPRLKDELQKLKEKKHPKIKRKKTGAEILAEGEPAPKIHPAMDLVDGVLLYGFRYGEEALWITSKREVLSEEELKAKYGEPATLPASHGPSQQSCIKWRAGTPADSTHLYQRILTYLRRHVIFQHPWQEVVIALWILNTYLYRIHPVCPGLHVTAPEKASGKTRLLDVMASICFGKPQLQVDPSEAVLFREPELTALPLFWDEAETLYRGAKSERDERLSVLNAGYRKGAVVKRFDKNAGRILSYEAYRPTVLCGITRLPETTASRCVSLELQRKKASETIHDFNPSRAQPQIDLLRDDCYLWALQNAPDVAEAYRVPDALPLPHALQGRLREILEPLFAIAAVLDAANISGPSLTALQEAANQLAGKASERETEESARIEALQILYLNFPDAEQVWALKTEQWMKLCQNNGMDWIEKPRQAQRLLNAWGLNSSVGRIGASSYAPITSPATYSWIKWNDTLPAY